MINSEKKSSFLGEVEGPYTVVILKLVVDSRKVMVMERQNSRATMSEMSKTPSSHNIIMPPRVPMAGCGT